MSESASASKPDPRRRLRLGPKRIVLALLLIGVLMLAVLGGQATWLVFAKPGSFPQGPALLMEAVESAQPPAGREHDAPNAHALLWDAYAIYSTERTRIDTRLSETFDARAEADPAWDALIDRARLRSPQLDFSMVGDPIEDSLSAIEGDTWQDAEREYYELIERESREAIGPMLDAGLREALAQLAASPRATMVEPAPNQPLIGILLPELGNARQLARFNRARMRLALERGDELEFVQAYEEGLALARVTGTQPVLISQLVTYAILAMMLEEGNDALVGGDLADETILAMGEALRRQVPKPIDAAFGMKGERLWVIDIVHRSHTDSENGMFMPGEYQKYMWNPAGGLRIQNALGVLAPRKQETLARVNEAYDLLDRMASVPPMQRVDLESRLMDMLDASRGMSPILRDFVPAIGKAMQSADRISATLESSRLALHVERHRIRTGELPAGQRELENLGSPVSIDPFAPDGAKLRYARSSRAPRGFVVYSVGFDGVDNGGVPGLETYRQWQGTGEAPTDAVVGGRGLRKLGLSGVMVDGLVPPDETPEAGPDDQDD